LDELTSLVYKELYRLARRYMAREAQAHTLQATALVNEAFVRLIEGKRVEWPDRAHFFALSAKLMRRILVDHARARRAKKRGGAAYPIALEEAAVVAPRRGLDLIALDNALEKLATIDPRKSQVVELRFFGGLSVEETSEVLKIAPPTVHSDFDKAIPVRTEVGNA
jgi:RNA polymerase sigma factor (TIGR02999 family)